MESVRLAPRTDARPDLEYEPPAWYSSARCVDADPDVFFAEGKGTNDAAKAVEVCQSCPVLYDCLIYAVDDASLVGVWGGTTEKERRSLRRQPRAS